MTKFCKDCKWCGHKEKTLWQKITFTYVPSIEFAKCMHEKAKIQWKSDNDNYLVDGVDRREHTYCSIIRGNYTGKEICGPDAKLFEPKE